MRKKAVYRIQHGYGPDSILLELRRNLLKRLPVVAASIFLLLLSACSDITISDPNTNGGSPGGSSSGVVVGNTSGPAGNSTGKATPTAPVQPGNPGGVGAAGKRRGPASIYPNPKLTPGDVFPGVTAAEVCQPGYSKSVRAVSSEEKAAVYQSYGIPDEPGKHEVDHFISLELGGSNNIKNLWPEPYEPKPGAHEKDTVENALHDEVCAGRMSLSEAQKIIVDDWYAYYLQIQHS